MSLKTLSGTVSAIGEATHTSGHTGQRGMIRSKQITNFRIDNNSVIYQSGQPIGLNDGDEVFVAGKDKNGVLEAYAVKNKTVGAVYDGSPLKVAFGFFVIFLASIGLCISIFGAILGIPGIFYSLYGFYKSYVLKQASDLVRNQ